MRKSSGLLTFEMLRNYKFKEKIPGGRAKGLKPDDFDATQLADGTKVEMEHTVDVDLATEIAMDHLREDKDYYKKLKTIDPHHKGVTAMNTKIPTRVQHQGEFYVIAEDQKVEQAKNDVGKVRERIKGAIGLIHDKDFDGASKLLEELLGDLEEAKEDLKEEAKK